MAQVMLRAPLSELCGGRTHAIPGDTVGEVLVALERDHPPIAGWVLDERGRIREHVNVFVGNTAARASGGLATTLADGVEISIIAAISGG